MLTKLSLNVTLKEYKANVTNIDLVYKNYVFQAYVKRKQFVLPTQEYICDASVIKQVRNFNHVCFYQSLNTANYVSVQ